MRYNNRSYRPQLWLVQGDRKLCDGYKQEMTQHNNVQDNPRSWTPVAICGILTVFSIFMPLDFFTMCVVTLVVVCIQERGR